MQRTQRSQRPETPNERRLALTLRTLSDGLLPFVLTRAPVKANLLSLAAWPFAGALDSKAREATLHSMDYRERITIDPRIRSGKPCIRGTRIAVADVFDYLGGGMSIAEVPTWSASNSSRRRSASAMPSALAYLTSRPRPARSPTPRKFGRGRTPDRHEARAPAV